MPAKRKPSKRATSKRPTPKPAAPKRAAAKPAAPKKPAPKKPAPKKPAPKTTPVKRGAAPREAKRSAGTIREARRPEPAITAPSPAEPPQEEEIWPAEPQFAPIVRGESAPATSPSSAVPAPAWGAEAPAAPMERGGTTYREDVPTAIVAAILAVSIFLPWYRGEGGLDVTVSAWSSGTWGPIIFFLALGSFLLIGLRRLGVTLSLPFEEALLHELGGWVALAGGVIKSRYRPGPEGLLGLSWGLWVGLGAAFLLAFLAGRMSPHASIVRRPKWYRERGGAIALVLLLGVVAGASVFATVNSAEPLGSTDGSGDIPGLVRGALPDCAGEFPLPDGVEPVQGLEQPCQVTLRSDRSSAEVVTAMKAAFDAAGWTVVAGETGTYTLITITRPKCATVAIVDADPGSSVVVAFGICGTPQATPS